MWESWFGLANSTMFGSDGQAKYDHVILIITTQYQALRLHCQFLCEPCPFKFILSTVDKMNLNGHGRPFKLFVSSWLLPVIRFETRSTLKMSKSARKTVSVSFVTSNGGFIQLDWRDKDRRDR